MIVTRVSVGQGLRIDRVTSAWRVRAVGSASYASLFEMLLARFWMRPVAQFGHTTYVLRGERGTKTYWSDIDVPGV